jgi:hypothetical protein
MNMKKVLFLALFLFPVGLLAQVVAQSPLPLNGAVGAVNSATSWLPASVSATVLMVLGFIVTEAAAHGIPTAKPISWFLGLSAVLGSVVLFLQKLQSLCNTLGNSLQNSNSSSTPTSGK